MGLRILAGTLLVLVSWLLLTVAVTALGRWAAVVVDRGRNSMVILRGSLWWGVSVGVLLVLALSLVTGLGSGVAATTVITAVVALGLVGLVLRPARRPALRRPTGSAIALLAALATALVYLAVKALGPVTNYDTGLYHLGSVKYAADFSAVPGIATLFFPFGYANAQFPLAALLGNGPWDGIGYRLLNGLLVVLVATDLAIRLLSRNKGWGTYVLASGLSASLIPLVAMADALVTSPTADTAVLLLTIVAAAYLADVLGRNGPARLETSVVLLVTALTVALRPTMLFYALGIVIVLGARLRRRRSQGSGGAVHWLLTTGVIVSIGILLALRDRILSGWLLYPLSILPMDVPWRSPDPTGWRDATLAAARDPQAPDQYVVAHSWSWIPAWIERLPTQWETWFLLTGIVVTVVAVIVARRHGGFPRRPRLLFASLLPSGLAVAVWFTLSPPSFRFIWGPLFTAVFLVLGAAARDLDRASSEPPGRPPQRRHLGLLLAGCATAVLAVVAYSGVARNQLDQVGEERAWALLGLQVPYAVAPVPLPPVVPVTMQSGLVLITPESGDQCWDNYPLCSYSMGDRIALRGDTIQDGFTLSR
jgi:hypothetical protein